MEPRDRSFRGTTYSETDLSEVPEIKLQGYIYSWGKNKDGELGIGNNKNAMLPTPIKGLKDKRIVQVSCGGQHTAVLTDDGQLYVCGSSLHGKLGLEDMTFVSINKFHFAAFLKGLRVVQVACGEYHTLCLLDTGVVYAWGGMLHKKLGQKGGRPAPISGFGDKKVMYVDCGDFHSVALTEKGELYSWGGGGSYYNKGQCGHGTLNDIEVPELIKFFKGKVVRQVSSGGYHNMALTSDGELYGWGSGSYGECGFGEFVDSATPRKVTININQKLYQQVLDDIILVDKSITPKILTISCGGHHSMILTDKGLFTCGYASHGQLGLRNITNQCDPQFVYTISNNIAAGWIHSLALTDRLDLYACGYGLFGQLGINTEESKTTFVHVASLRGKNIKGVFAGGNHSWIVLDENNPINEDYEPPSPLRSLIVTPTKSRDASPDPRAERNLSEGDLPLKGMAKADRVLQVVFSENDMCHRFVRFVIEEKEYEQFKIKLDDYIKEAYALDTGLLLHKLQNDADIVEEVNGFGKIVSPNISSTAKSFTLMMVADPRRATPPILPSTNTNKISTSFHTSSTVIGEMQLMKESDINKDESQRALSNWMTMFLEQFGGRLPTIKFFELRPAIYG